MLLIIGGVLISLNIVALFLLKRQSRATKATLEDVVFVLAHPDDEAMFFLPSLLHIHSKKLICLSSGDADGLGEVRKRELSAVTERLNFGEVVVGPFEDGFTNEWHETTVAHFIAQSLGHAKTIVTFDSYGVSGHPNHRATYRGVLAFKAMNKNIDVWVLQSDSLPLKYSGPVGALIQALSQAILPGKQVFINHDIVRAYETMAIHESQFVWFRRLFVIFARCVYINILVNVDSQIGTTSHTND